MAVCASWCQTELGGSLVSSTVAVLGVSFRAGQAARWELAPHGVTAEGCATAIDAAAGADAVVVATEWQEFRELDWNAFSAVMTGRVVIDTRSVIDSVAGQRAGLKVFVLGRKTSGDA